MQNTCSISCETPNFNDGTMFTFERTIINDNEFIIPQVEEIIDQDLKKYKMASQTLLITISKTI
jgi:hypothetical protein